MNGRQGLDTVWLHADNPAVRTYTFIYGSKQGSLPAVIAESTAPAC
jgi:hypothetical protein